MKFTKYNFQYLDFINLSYVNFYLQTDEYFSKFYYHTPIMLFLDGRIKVKFLKKTVVKTFNINFFSMRIIEG